LPQPALIPAPPSVEPTEPSGPASRLEDAPVLLEDPLLPLDETVDAPELELPGAPELAAVDPDELSPPEVPPDEAVDAPEEEPPSEPELLAVVDPVPDELEPQATLRIENNSPFIIRD
jgi:hypothetical protein